MSTTARLAAGAGASVLAFTALAMPHVRAAEDVRAAWIARTSLISPQAIEDALTVAKRDGFNTALVQVRARGYADFLKGVEPRPGAVPERPLTPGLSDMVVSVGWMCQRPNKPEVTSNPRQSPHNDTADPSRTPRRANSSGMAVSSRIDTVSSKISCRLSTCPR